MKKIIAIVVLLFISAVVFLTTVDINRLGKNNVYVEVQEPTDIQEQRLDNGEIVSTYWYEQTGYKENGESMAIQFSAQKELRQGAYLMLYVKNENQVTSYDEVQLDEIPTAVQDELGS